MANGYTEEQKAEVIAALLTGLSIRQAAEKFKIPRGTISHWSGAMSTDDGLAETIRVTKQRIGDLLLECIRVALEGHIARERLFADETYLRSQPLSEVKVLHGICQDKTARLLDSVAEVEPAGDEGSESEGSQS